MINYSDRSVMKDFIALLPYDETLEYLKSKFHVGEEWDTTTEVGKENINLFFYHYRKNLFIIYYIDKKEKELVKKVELEYKNLGHNDLFDLAFAINSVFNISYHMFWELSDVFGKNEKKIINSVINDILQIKKQFKESSYEVVKEKYTAQLSSRGVVYPWIVSDKSSDISEILNKGRKKTVTTRECFEEIKILIVSRAIWAEFKKRDITTKSWRALKDFLNNLPIEEISYEISMNCNLSLDAANYYIKQFIENADKYIDSKDVDTELFITILQNHPELMAQSSIVVEKNWKEENAQKIETARHELEEITSTISKKTAEIGDLNILIEKKQAEAAEIESVISRKKQLVQQVETKVAEKIKAARENAADFISEMTFGGITTAAEQECIISQNDEIIDADVEYDNYKNLCNNLSENLVRLGVNKKKAPDLAYAMYSAYRNRIPLLFAGPSAAAFGDAFSASLFGEYSAHVSCLREFKENYVAPICGCESEIITFSNNLHDKWLNRMVEIMNSSGKYFFFTTPFYEDLSVEPSSSLNYYIPIFTDLLIDEKAKDYHFEGGRAAEGFKHFEIKKARKSSYSDLLKQLKLSPYVRAIYNQQIANVTTMRKEDDPEEMIMIMLLSAAFITGKTEIVSKYISDHILNNDFEEFVKDFIGEQE